MTVDCRMATLADAELINNFIVELAEYENAAHLVTSTAEAVREQLQKENPPFECVIAEVHGEPAGFALFFQSYSTWEGKEGLYLEDLFVRPSARKFGVGRALFERLNQIAKERNYARIDWKVLNWNKLAIDFYDRLGAISMADWIPYRLDVNVSTDVPAHTNRQVGG